jgi:hypothetical protein
VTFSTDFDFGDRVKIDSGAVEAIVISFCFYPHGAQVQVSWWNAGALLEAWVAPWRLSKVEQS